MDSHRKGSFHPVPIEDFGVLREKKKKIGEIVIGHKVCESLRSDQIYTSQRFFVSLQKKNYTFML